MCYLQNFTPALSDVITLNKAEFKYVQYFTSIFTRNIKIAHVQYF